MGLVRGANQEPFRPRFQPMVLESEWKPRPIQTPAGNVILLPHVHVMSIDVEQSYGGYNVTVESWVQASQGSARIPLRFTHVYGCPFHSATEEANAIADALHELWAHELAECIRDVTRRPYVDPHPDGPTGRADGWHQGEHIDAYDGHKVRS